MMTTDTDRSQVELAGLSNDPANNIPVMVLKETTGEKRVLPIWVSLADATAIAIRKSGMPGPDKPLTIDVLLSLFKAFEIMPLEVEITAISNSLYCAVLTCSQGEKLVELPIRPSDGVLLSILNSVPIYCRQTVFQTLADLQNENGEMPILRENDCDLSEIITARLAKIFGHGADGEGKVDETTLKDLLAEEEPFEEPDGGPAALLLGDESVDPDILKELLKNLDRRYFGRYKM